jgi:hypothetical protein
MSLVKTECENCWLPPEENSKICRKCRGTPYPSDVELIRYYIHTIPECKKFRNLVLNPTYTSSVLPENCISCQHFLVRLYPEHKGLSSSMAWWFIKTPMNTLQDFFTYWIKERRQALMLYLYDVIPLLNQHPATCKKIIEALTLSVPKEKIRWILHEYVIQPAAYQELLKDPFVLPSHCSENFWGYFEEFEAWWSFWQEIPAILRKKILFRCMTYREELLSRTWHPDRCKEWCFDIEESSRIGMEWKKSA